MSARLERKKMECSGWVDGWMDGWMGGWVGVKARLRIAYSNQKYKLTTCKAQNGQS